MMHDIKYILQYAKSNGIIYPMDAKQVIWSSFTKFIRGDINYITLSGGGSFFKSGKVKSIIMKWKG